VENWYPSASVYFVQKLGALEVTKDIKPIQEIIGEKRIAD